MSAADTARPHTILITGASDGIGLLLARDYAKRGHRVLATGRRQISNDVEVFGSPNVIYVSADLSDPAHAAGRVSAAMQELGWKELDLAILNGATAWVCAPHQEPGDKITNQIDVNFRSQIHLAHALAPLLFAAKGQLVVVGSTSYKKAQGQFATYSATKAALDGFCRALSAEWQGRADVLIVHPGPTRTTMHAKAGLKIGAARLFFMSPKKAARVIQLAVRDRKGRQLRQTITRPYAFRTLFSRFRDGQL